MCPCYQLVSDTDLRNSFFYYGTVIFQGTGINNSFVTQMILNGINFGTTFYGLYIVERKFRPKLALQPLELGHIQRPIYVDTH